MNDSTAAKKAETLTVEHPARREISLIDEP
jgi:hypothetical protein